MNHGLRRDVWRQWSFQGDMLLLRRYNGSIHQALALALYRRFWAVAEHRASDELIGVLLDGSLGLGTQLEFLHWLRDQLFERRLLSGLVTGAAHFAVLAHFGQPLLKLTSLGRVGVSQTTIAGSGT